MFLITGIYEEFIFSKKIFFLKKKNRTKTKQMIKVTPQCAPAWDSTETCARLLSSETTVHASTHFPIAWDIVEQFYRSTRQFLPASDRVPLRLSGYSIDEHGAQAIGTGLQNHIIDHLLLRECRISPIIPTLAIALAR